MHTPSRSGPAACTYVGNLGRGQRGRCQRLEKYCGHESQIFIPASGDVGFPDKRIRLRRTLKSCGLHACHDCIVEEARAFGTIQKHGGDESESCSRTCGARGDRDLKEAMLRRRDLSTSAIGLATSGTPPPMQESPAQCRAITRGVSTRASLRIRGTGGPPVHRLAQCRNLL